MSTDDAIGSPDPHPNAGRDSGYVDEHGNSVGEHLVNRVTELMLGPQTKMIQLAARLDALAMQQDATIAQQDQRFGYVLSQLSAFFEKEDTRHDAYGEELQALARRVFEFNDSMKQILALGKDTTKRLGNIDRAVGDINTRLSNVEQGQLAQGERIDAALARIEALEDNNHRLEALETAHRQAGGG